ncbi:MAG: T9SS type A sorting domain-containing protein [Bacteroidota bacterium]
MNRLPVLLIVSIACITALFGQRLQKTNRQEVVAGWNSLDINTINATLSYDGVFADYRKTNSAGLLWPIGTKIASVYTSGLWVVGKHRPTDSLRTAVMYYSSEYQPGKILTTFNTSTLLNSADDPSKPEYRLYKSTRGMTGEDYENWPVQLGAPFNDVNSNGTWDPGVDSPLRWGDQQLWTVSNDLNIGYHNAYGRTLPMGIELQSTFFGYDMPGALGNTVFMRYKIINKSDADYDSVYIGYWNDIDLGDANDDMFGSDTVRNMYYVYNADNADDGPTGYGTTPPATGFVLLQGPAVATGNLSDTALVEGKKRAGYKNQDMSSSVVYFSGGGGLGWADPPLTLSNFSLYAFRNLKGLPRDGAPFTDPETNQQTPFVFAGDPVTGTGWILSKTATAQDIRGLLGSGPFTLAQNDTQEVVIAYVIARGADRLASITLLRNYVDEITNIYRADFSGNGLITQAPNIYRKIPADQFAFGRHEIGSTSDTIKYFITNLGIDPLNLHFGAIANAAFLRTSPAGPSVSLPVNTSAAVSIVFQPTEFGNTTDSLVITSNDPFDEQFVLPLSGYGLEINTVNVGVLYATNSSSLYTISPTTGAAVPVTSLESGAKVTAFAVRPSTHELISIGPGQMARISADGPSHIPYPYTFKGYTFSGGAAFMNDSMLAFAGDSIIGRININTGAIDTVHHFLTTYQVRSLAYNHLTDEIFFSIRTMFNTIPDTGDAIFKINVSTKAMTRIGRTKLGIRIRSLLFDKNGMLYGLVDSLGTKPALLITIDTATGQGTYIGSSGMMNLVSLAMDPSTVAGTRKSGNSAPEIFTLYQNYPNPFNPSTTISYYLPSPSPVRLELFDVLGRSRALLVDEWQESGAHRFRLDIAEMKLSSGVYFYRLQSGSFSDVKKMSVLK